MPATPRIPWKPSVTFCRPTDRIGRLADRKRLRFCRYSAKVLSERRQLGEVILTVDRQDLVQEDVPLRRGQISTKRGFPVYRSNPSVPASSNAMATRNKRIHVPGGSGSVIVDNSTGEIKGIGGMGFWWEEEVDTSRFVKLFLDGIKQAAGLSKAGLAVFEMVYHQMRAQPGNDEIKLNTFVARDHGMSDRSYQRGVRELLEKEFLYRSPSDGVFFVNIRFMFNGDRLAFVKSYHLKNSSRTHQTELPLLAPKPE